ncbi:hypothetical protein Dimus_022223 [Dionaea muscipula]
MCEMEAAGGFYDRHSLAAPLIAAEHEPPKLNKIEANDHRYGYHGDASFFKTFFNGLNALSGVGILSIPYALASGGWLSLVLFFAVAFSAFYASLLIKWSMDVDPNIRTYPDIAGCAFGSIGRSVASVLMYMELYMVVTGFLILEGDNLHNLFPEMELKVGGLVIGGRESFIMIVALVILPSVWVDSLSILSYVSASGVLASAAILVSILWVGAFDGVGFHHKGELWNWKGLPTSVSLYAFCYCAHPVFPTVYTSMRKRHHFSKVLFLCFLCSTISYASMAIAGYMMFGAKVDSQITLNLPIDKLSSKVAIYTTLVNPVSKYALMIAPVVNASESWLPNYHEKRPMKLLIRTTLVVSTVIVALAVPMFGYLMSLVGAFLSVSASIIVPCLCYLKISGASSRGIELVTIIGIILLSILIVIFGTYTSLVQIISGTSVGY